MSNLSNTQEKSTFADHWEFVGPAIEEPGYTIWGTSPITGPEGKTHLFVARWPGELKVDPGWRSHSEIAHYIGDSPEGPFLFSDVALTGSGKDTWDKFGAHNPLIVKIEGQKDKSKQDKTGTSDPAMHKAEGYYSLLYIGNDNPNQPPHPSNQCIGMAVSENLYGPWERVGKDGKILAPPDNPRYWNYKAGNGVNNPAFLQHPEGGYFLYFKSKGAKMGLAIAEKPEGPYVQLPFPVTQNNLTVEDGYAFIYKGKICLLTTDNHGLILAGGGILWSSDNGIHFDQIEQGFKRAGDYIDIDMAKITTHYGPKNRTYVKFERPQILLINGKPKYMYVPSGRNIYGGDCTISYILKFVE